jgi:hypothetical protein
MTYPELSNNKLYLGLTFIAIMIYVGLLDTTYLYAQSAQSAQLMSMTNITSAQQHAAHTLDNLIVSEHIPLKGQLLNGDYILLMDFTPFATSIEGHSHIAMKVPCNENASPKITIVTGIAPNFKTLDIGNAIKNGTLDEQNLDLSAEGRSCLYHAELPNGITDIALVNTSNGTLNFDDGGYSVTVSVHGTAIQHIGSNRTTGSSS